MRVLVTGGAGYIGSVVATQLIAAGHEVTVLDDLSTGFADAVPPGATFVKGTLRDCAAEVLSDGIEAVLHFAAKSLVGESVADPAKYWSNNLGGTVALLEAMRDMRIRTIVFSSTAAVYGEPERTPVTETDPTRPTSPYGASKIAVDTTLTEFSRMYGFGAVSLRYFNVAGAHQGADGRWLGERHNPETHLIPNVLAGRYASAALVRLWSPEHKVVLTTDANEAREIGRKSVDFYLGLSNYLNNWKRLGFTDEDLATPGSDKLIDAVVAHGSAGQIANRLDQHLQAGADHVAIQVLGGWDPLIPTLTELAGPLGLKSRA